MQKLPQFAFLDQLVQVIPQISTVLYGVPLVLVVLLIKTLTALQGLMHRFSEHRINHLGTSRPRLPRKVPSRLVVIVSIQPKIPLFLRDNLSLTFPLLLVFLNPLILVNLVHELVHTGDRLSHQRLP